MSFRFIAPIHPREPSSSAPLPRRTKRSAACTACKARRSRCGGEYPCDRCLESGSECVFGSLDRRRKCAQRLMEQELDTLQRQLDGIIEAFDNRDYEQLGKILDKVKEQRAGSGGRRRDHEIAGSRAQSDKPQSDPRASGVTRKGSPPSSSSTSSVGSLDKVDTLTEDPNRTEESRAAGYIAKAKDLEMDFLPGIQQESDIHGFNYRSPRNEMGGGAGARKRSLSSGLLHQESTNWGPDCTMCEGDYEQEYQQHLFVLDPTLFSVGM
ncbi:hypothetical protein BDV11DRAFT_190131 [Aspergillus similis]